MDSIFYYGPILILTACASLPTTISPAECRELGVSVFDESPITGTITESHRADMNTIAAECGDPYMGLAYDGCTKQSSNGYIIWYADSEVMRHEACHALYERPYHIWRG
jgi:hypothetical protein